MFTPIPHVGRGLQPRPDGFWPGRFENPPIRGLTAWAIAANRVRVEEVISVDFLTSFFSYFDYSLR
ncbi:MAG: hypothetical protein ACRER2_11715 [Methylococcales bacterium]